MKKFILICSVVILIFVIILIAVKIYEKNLVEDNRNAVIEDLNKIAETALEYYSAPLQIGGGDSNWVPMIDGEYLLNRCALWLNFSGVIDGNPGDEFITENGTYKLWLNSWEDKTLNLLGTGFETGNDGKKPVAVRMNLNGPTKGISITIIN